MEKKISICWSDADFKVETRTSLCWRDAALSCCLSASVLQTEDPPFVWCGNVVLSVTKCEYFKVEAQLSLRVEAQLSGFAKMRAREYWRDAVFEVETRLSRCWSDADFKVETQIFLRLAFWVHCHMSSGAQRDIVILKREVHVLDALSRVWQWSVSRNGPCISINYCVYKKTAVVQESSLDSFLLRWTLRPEF